MVARDTSAIEMEKSVFGIFCRFKREPRKRVEALSTEKIYTSSLTKYLGLRTRTNRPSKTANYKDFARPELAIGNVRGAIKAASHLQSPITSPPQGDPPGLIS